MKCYDVILCATSHPAYDQRLAKICKTLAEAGISVLQIGRRKINNDVVANTDKYAVQYLHCKYTNGFLFYAEYNLRLFLKLMKLKAKIICANDADTLMACGITSILKQSILFYDSHEFFTQSPELKGRAGVRRVWDAIERIFTKKVHTFYTVSQSLVDIFEKRFGMEVHLVRNLPYPMGNESYTERKSYDQKIILYQGVLNVGRGLYEAIDMMGYLAEYELWIAGEGDLTVELKSYAESKDYHHRIKFYGMLDPESLKSLTKHARFGLNLLDGENPNYYYSLANKFFDYLVLGVPCITMNFPEYSRIFSEYKAGILIDDLSPEKMAQEIKVIDESDPAVYNMLVSNAHILSKKYNWEKESHKLLELYKICLS